MERKKVAQWWLLVVFKKQQFHSLILNSVLVMIFEITAAQIRFTIKICTPSSSTWANTLGFHTRPVSNFQQKLGIVQ